MQVEIYEMKEIDSETLTPELDSEAIELIEELGLNGQKSLTVKNDDEPGKRHHYSAVTAEQQMIIEELFCSLTKVDEYDHGPIPVRVLKEIKWAKDFFKKLYICHTPPASISDPILCGTNCTYIYGDHSKGLFSAEKPYLIARWGDALESWEDLAKQAALKARERLIGEVTTAIANLKHQKDLLEAGAPIKNRSPNLLASLPVQ